MKIMKDQSSDFFLLGKVDTEYKFLPHFLEVLFKVRNYVFTF